jgi:hypothetical protein
VHALSHAHELLVPGGTLVDLHPVTEEHVESRDGPIGPIADPAWLAGDLPNAERRLQEAIDDGLFALEAELSLDVLQHYDTAGDLLDAKRDALATQESLVRRISEAVPPLVIREHAVARRLRAL